MQPLRAHAAAGVKPYNSGKRCVIDTTTKKCQRVRLTLAQFTSAELRTINALRAAYGTSKPFPARTQSAMHCAILLRNGYATMHSGAESGGIYSDGEQPLQLKLTAKLQKLFA